MGVRYVEVTLEDMQRAVRRRLRGFRPRWNTSTFKGVTMHVVDLKIDDHVGIRIWTSITVNRGDVGKAVGEGSIKVQLVSLQRKVPLQRKENRAAIVQRSTNWPDNLEKRVYEVQLDYEGSPDFWTAQAMKKDGVRAPGKPEPEPVSEPAPGPPKGDTPERPRYSGPAVSEPQIKYLVSLIITARNAGIWDDYARDFGLDPGYVTKNALREKLTGGRDGTASKLIGQLIKATKGMGGRYAALEEELEGDDPIALRAGDIEHDLYGDPPS